MIPLLLQPQNLNGLAADEQTENNIRRGGVPFFWAGRLRARLERFGDHGGPEAGLDDARDGQVAGLGEGMCAGGECAHVWADGLDEGIAVGGGHAQELAEEDRGVHCGRVRANWMVEGGEYTLT